MGCGSSRVNPEGNEASTPRPLPPPKKSQQVNGHVGNTDVKKNTVDTNSNCANITTNNLAPKSVAFQVTLDGEKTDSLIMKHPPIKLKRLAPLNVPTMTAEELAEKQKLADEKREKEIQRKVSASRRTSKRRKEILKAKEFEEKQQIDTEKEKINDSLKTAELMRQAKLDEIREKQRIREERARRARERAKRINQADEEGIGILDQVEKDETFNADDDSYQWADGSSKDDEFNSESGERIYSGYTSPTKQPFQSAPPPSAGTLDSYNDNAFARNVPSASSQRRTGNDEDKDEFFDS